MTSMPLTLRTILRASISVSVLLLPPLGEGWDGGTRALACAGECPHPNPPPKGRGQVTSGLAIRGRATRHLLVRQVLLRPGLHHRLDDLFVRLVPVAGEVPLAAIPGLDACPGGPHVVA